MMLIVSLFKKKALHDYMGEPGQWPHVSSSFGAIDLAGFMKPPAYFYRSKVRAFPTGLAAWSIILFLSSFFSC